MTRDPLATLLRLRHIEVDRARRDLADCLRTEDEAETVATAIANAIEHEAEVVTDLGAGDAEVEAFGAWLRRMRPRQQTARMAVDQAVIDTATARAALAMAQAAVRAVEQMRAEHAAEARVASERAAQREIDEMARRRELAGHVM